MKQGQFTLMAYVSIKNTVYSAILGVYETRHPVNGSRAFNFLNNLRHDATFKVTCLATGGGVNKETPIYYRGGGSPLQILRLNIVAEAQIGNHKLNQDKSIWSRGMQNN